MIIPLPVKSQTKVVEVFSVDPSGAARVPLYTSPVSAGLPSVAEDYTEGRIDLSQHLIKHPQDTFVVRVSGDSMINAGISPDDLLVVDRALNPQPGNIVIAVINGDLTVKRLIKQGDAVYLMPENAGYPGIEVTEEMQFMIWGVVTSVIHKL